MECADVELAPEPPGREGAESLDFEAAERIRQALGRPHGIPIDADLSPQKGHVRVLPDVVDRLLARPTERVDTGVHHEERRRQCDIGQHPEPRRIRRIQPHLVRQLLGVLGPPLAHAGRPEEARDLRDRVAALHRDRSLQVMTGNRFVERERLEVRTRFVPWVIG